MQKVLTFKKIQFKFQLNYGAAFLTKITNILLFKLY